MNENVSIPPKVFAYYFPNYHVDPVNEDRYGAGWTEWEILRGARPRFPGHYQPRVPARGYENEADPIVAAEYVSMARAHGIDGFIFDYYWYQGRPYLQGALEDGFMNSVNFENIEFSLMWANHDWVELFPSADPTTTPPELASGGVAIEQFVEFTQYVIDRYFVRENYTRVSGKPRFSIYEPARFVKGMGGLKQAQDALDGFNSRAEQAGHKGVHIDLIASGFAILPTESDKSFSSDVVLDLRAASVSAYVWIHELQPERAKFPVDDSWETFGEEVFAKYEEYAAALPVPFYPNVTVGWDSSPRTAQTRDFELGEYPWISVWQSTPTEFEAALHRALDFVSRHSPSGGEITINAWNEWTEGSYLLPDERNGAAYLKAVQSVFGDKTQENRR